jgi:hypothetical protein
MVAVAHEVSFVVTLRISLDASMVAAARVTACIPLDAVLVRAVFVTALIPRWFHESGGTRFI